MGRALLTLVGVTVALLALGCGAVLPEERIRCKVCDRAIAHIWHQGVELRTHCNVHGTDPRCDITNVHKHGVEEMVKDVCEDLPKTHQALMDDGFEMIKSSDPKHDDALIEAIRAACVKWVHDEHSIDFVTRLIWANLDAGKSTQTILHGLQERFCANACRKVQEEDEDEGRGLEL